MTAIQIDQGVITTATKSGLRPTAIPDITARARTVFRLVDGAPRAYEADGQTVRVGKDGITPMTLEPERAVRSESVRERRQRIKDLPPRAARILLEDR